MFAKNISKQQPCLVINYLRKIRHNQVSILKSLSNLPKNLMCFYNVLYGKRKKFKNSSKSRNKRSLENDII